jgi:LPS export ABC transporter protein LptC
MKGFIRKQWPLLGLCILLVVVALYLVKSDKKAIRETLFEEILPDEGLVIKGFQYNQENPDKGIKWALDAEEMRSSSDNNLISFHDFLLTVKSENRPSFELKGEKGDYSRDSGKINLRGNLYGASSDGYRIVTSQILINENTGLLNTDGHVKIFGPFFSIEGQGLIIDVENETIKILSNVTSVINEDSIAR